MVKSVVNMMKISKDDVRILKEDGSGDGGEDELPSVLGGE